MQERQGEETRWGVWWVVTLEDVWARFEEKEGCDAVYVGRGRVGGVAQGAGWRG